MLHASHELADLRARGEAAKTLEADLNLKLEARREAEQRKHRGNQAPRPQKTLFFPCFLLCEDDTATSEARALFMDSGHRCLPQLLEHSCVVNRFRNRERRARVQTHSFSALVAVATCR